MALELPHLDFMSTSDGLSYVFDQFYGIGKFLIGFGILAFVLWFALNKLHILKPSIRVLIKEKNGVKFDVGRKVTVKGGATKLFLTKERVNISYPISDYLLPLKKPFGLSYLYTIRKLGEGQYNPMVYGNPSDKIEVMSENTKAWTLNEMEEAHNAYLKHDGFFEKYQVLISFTILAGVFLVMILFSLGYMEQVIAAFNTLVGRMATVQTIN